MFTLLSGLYNAHWRRREIKILLVGPANAGKTTMLNTYKRLFGLRFQDPTAITPTLGFNIANLPYNRSKRILMWDVGGQGGRWRHYLEEAQGVLFVVDSADPQRWSDAKATLEEMLTSLGDREVPFVVCANKNDLSSAVAEELSIALGLPKKWVLCCDTVSGFGGDGLREALTKLVESATEC
ncbi:MAG: hypothetical protein KVP17_001756 [Porospora cf. gigantea B]|uniref:uncharacterized protein n=1 Tax=Porospora cf. gigantea B TaxID=2853592 RepID=UPI003571A918|nr:MAG: hypothetical protein KVP17_001756 [Porospora cf. gigantea B]